MKRKSLGKGLGALITTADHEDENTIEEININEIDPNIDQPRKNFDDEKLSQLADSIKQHGVIQPIIVRNEDQGYKIVAGERRWRAARIAGLGKVPVLIKNMTTRESVEIALIENLQREDLNPIEEAEAYSKLMSEHKMTQDRISKLIGKSRSAIANSLRLLNLSDENKERIIKGALSSGHARALLVIEDEHLQNKAAEEIIKNEVNVRDTEKMVKKVLGSNKKKKKKVENKDEEYIAIEERLKDIFKTRVYIQRGKKKSKITIEYYSDNELERILQLMDDIKKTG